MDTYDGIGAPPYSPKMLRSLVVFAYINGVYSLSLIHIYMAALDMKSRLSKYGELRNSLSPSQIDCLGRTVAVSYTHLFTSYPIVKPHFCLPAFKNGLSS